MLKRNITRVLDEGKIMQWRREQSGPYGEELFPLCSGRKIQNETIVVDYGGV